MEIMRNLELYDMGRSVPEEAKKPINAGRLKGMTDINPMWRIKRLTEIFGPCGIGWWYVIKDKRLQAGAKDEVCAFVDIDLYYKWHDTVSQPVPGTGGSKFVALEKNGLYTSDECFKMALTDAISVSAKAIGIGADVYYAADRDKYTSGESVEPPKAPMPQDEYEYFCDDCGLPIADFTDPNGKIVKAAQIVNRSKKKFGRCLCIACGTKANTAQAQYNAVPPIDEATS